MFKKIVDRLQDYFGISRKEARGAILLIALCFVVLWMPFIFRRWMLPLFPPMSAPIDMKMLDSIAAGLERANQAKLKNRTAYPSKSFKKIPALDVRLFDFNPNTASVNILTDLGIPAFLANRIEKFRMKGGKFRRKDDLLKIYDFPEDLYLRLEKHIVLPAEVSDREPVIASPKTTTRTFETSNTPRFAKPVIETFDINAADTTQLIKLKGIGSKLSQRILKFRDALGGFYSINQYSEIFGLDSLALSELNHYAKVIGPVKKVNINTISAAELGKHSYFRDRKIVNVIINYRDQHGYFQGSDDLKKTKVLEESWIKKVEPYLSF
ncbi:ComEA family DNA-binding protein [Dyadobacter arcticus]|uniref:DNA uptake protein ComE-like DNA-binding protein n=1 Tax=Dyadobacter arcticus TaxID=1078754 RepID=A0ABX0UH61_9BACT|nr:helix-hairpin-helix domain-containing protein [Dyadobacter arcticus]NIJ51838.1 DNA uptake protein ComE-like DNA-binding protein [Dyadobacter arcticus]